jgi:tetratricopeptide (TPR) repeat protein
MRLFLSRALVASALLGLATAAGAQIPDTFTDLQVLPKDIDKASLVATMRGFAEALGVRCKYCHVGPDNLEGMDFATDELPSKKTARRMLQMVNVINEDHIAKLETERDTRIKVECKTCHRGVTLPMQIEDVLSASIEARGVDAAIRRYTELRDTYYGTAAYDFGPEPLGSLSARLFRNGNPDAAFALTGLNIELHPDHAWSRILLAGFYKAQGETDEAIAAYQEALKVDPDNEWVKAQLEALRKKE